MWNLTVINEEVEINLSVEDQAAATAIAAAARAQDAQLEAERLEGSSRELSIASSESAAESNNAKETSKEARDVAIAKATQTATDRTAVATDRTAIETAKETTDENAFQTGQDRTATGEDRIQTGQDRAKTELDRVESGNNVIATGEDRNQTGLDRVATGEDRAQTALYRIATGEDVVSAQLSESNAGLSKTAAEDSASEALASEAVATEQAILAIDARTLSEEYSINSENSNAQSAVSATVAVDAANIALQALDDTVAVSTGGTASLLPAAGKIPIAGASGKIDAGWIDPISGVNSQALHRSPSAVTSMFIYDTSKDSDGGAWTEKCQHTSWYNEELAGRWLGQFATEALARAVVGATTNDYFQLTTNGTFRSLNAVSGTTEIFRGNKASFPKVAGIVAEVGSVTIYDLTETGNPMWMRFVTGVSFNGIPLSIISSIYVINSIVCAGSTTGGLSIVNLSTDSFLRYGLTNNTRPYGGISSRNSNPITVFNVQGTFKTNDIRSIAMTYTADAPIDPATGLKVPTIAIGTGSGLSIINSKGQVVTSSNNSACQKVTLSPTLLTFHIGLGQIFYAKNPDKLGLNFTTDIFTSGHEFGNSTASALKSIGGSNLLKGINSALIKKGNINIHSLTKSLSSSIAPTYNTGYLVGDIRRAYLSDVTSGNIGSQEYATESSQFIPGDLSTYLVINSTSSFSYTQTDSSWKSLNWTIPVSAINKPLVLEFDLSNGVTSMFIGTVSGNWNILFNSVRIGKYRLSIPNLGQSTLNILFQGGSVCTVSNWSVKEAVYDNSFRFRSLNIFGTILKSLANAGTDLVGYSGFSNLDYLREPYSNELDFGTGEVHLSSWVKIPDVLNDSMFQLGPELVSNGTFDNSIGWTLEPNFVIENGILGFTYTSGDIRSNAIINVSIRPKASYILEFDYTEFPGFGSTYIYLGDNTTAIIIRNGTGRKTFYINNNSITLKNLYIRSVNRTSTFDNVTLKEFIPLSIIDRSFSNGSYFKLRLERSAFINSQFFDGTTTRTVTTPIAYNTNQWLKVESNYIAGRLSILINGVEVAATVGNPLLSLNNPEAVLTIGNSYELNAPFPGSLALLKLSATVPSAEQSSWMYEQEKYLFQENAKCILPDAGVVNDLTYDESTDTWMAISNTNESSWTGLVRTGIKTPTAGSFSKIDAKGGYKLSARTGTNIGVDVSTPSLGLKNEVNKRAESAARLSQDSVVFDFNGGFTANTIIGNVAITNVLLLSYPQSYIGTRIFGSGIPANTTVVGVSGNVIYLSNPATATATTVQISFLDYDLPAGFDATDVKITGVTKQEGITKDYTKLYDGFKQTIRFAVAPAHTSWIQIIAKKETI